MRVVREPLFQFLVIGAAIFAIHAVVARYRTDVPGEIVVTQGTIENLVTGFARTWQRPPSEGELQGLVRDYIREEAAYREALAVGLDRDDMIVRRRLRQKLEFLADDLATRTAPTDGDLRGFLETHRDLFQTEPLVSFRQVYFDPGRHGGDLDRDVRRALDELRRSGGHVGEPAVGDPLLLGQTFADVPPADVKSTFGESFAAAITAVPVGSWQGPLHSGYGVHLVYVERRTESRLPVLADIQDQVRREYLDTRRRQAEDRFYQTLLSRYRVRIEPLEGPKLARMQ